MQQEEVQDDDREHDWHRLQQAPQEVARAAALHGHAPPAPRTPTGPEAPALLVEIRPIERGIEAERTDNEVLELLVVHGDEVELVHPHDRRRLHDELLELPVERGSLFCIRQKSEPRSTGSSSSSS